MAKLVAPYVGAWIETRKLKKPLPIPESHPTWVRGLKPLSKLVNSASRKSHPTWVRGLKLLRHLPLLKLENVAPYVGAWIETTLISIVLLFAILSHPTWVRGLKPAKLKHWHGLPPVAPYVGAWIETTFLYTCTYVGK